MKKLVVFCISLCLLIVPALAGDVPLFSDVPASSPCAEAVALCCEAGIMTGTEPGVFEPDRRLKMGECAALAARLLDWQDGGRGALPDAPDQYGSGFFLDPDGIRVALANDVDLVFSADNGDPVVTFPPSLMASLRSGPSPVDRLTLVVDAGACVYHGSYQSAAPDQDGDASLEGYRFHVPEAAPEEASEYFLYHVLGSCGNWGPFTDRDQWFLNACWYLDTHSDVDTNALRRTNVLEADRSTFAALLSQVCPDSLLTPINQLTSLPDTDDPAALRLCRAGVMEGLDTFWTFYGKHPITRGEAAQILARVLAPELRLRHVPDVPGYALTPIGLDLDAYSIRNFDVTSSYAACGDLLYVRAYSEEEGPGAMAVMDENGAWIIPPEAGYDAIWPYGSDGVAAVEKGGLWGYVDRSGQVIVAPSYPMVTTLHDGILLAGDGLNDWTLLSPSGEPIGTYPASCAAYDSIAYEDTTGGLLRFHLDGRMGYLNLDGAVSLEAAWAEAAPFSEGLACVQNEAGFSGFINRSGKLVIPIQYESPASFRGGYAFLTDRYLLPDGSVHPLDIAIWGPVSDGRVLWGDRMNWPHFGYLDDQLRCVVPAILERGSAVSDGKAFVQADGKLYRLTFTKDY